MAKPEIALSPAVNAVSTAVPPPLLGEQTWKSLLANIVRVYRGHFGTIFLCGVLPILPFALLAQLLEARAPDWAPLVALPYVVVVFIASGALTVALSDICLGNQPTVRRAYARILGRRRWLHLLSTSLLVMVASYLSYLLLILPGLWFLTRSIFTSTVVTLEGRKNRAAIRRSFELTTGQAWRIAGLTLLSTLLAVLAAAVLLLVLGMGLELALPDSKFGEHIAGSMVILIMFVLILPTLGLTTVLLYYDQRVRRESYDAQALSEDLMR